MYDSPDNPISHHGDRRPLINQPERLLGVWAHPDDEAYLASGLMGRVADATGQVTCLTATHGELGFDVDDPRPLRQRAQLRRKELRNAMDVLGVADVRIDHWPDGGCADVPFEEAVDRIAGVMIETCPEVVVTFGPDGITGHADHKMICAATTAAWQQAGTGQLLYTAMTNDFFDRNRRMHDEIGIWEAEPATPVPTEDLALHLELSEAELDRKRRVLAAHASQTTGLAELIGEDVYRRWWREEMFRLPTPTELFEAAAARTPPGETDSFAHSRRRRPTPAVA